MGSSEAVEFLVGCLTGVVVFGLRGEDLFDEIPELLVFGVQEDDEAGGLGVEGAGDVEDGFCDELLDAGVGDGDFLCERVEGATGFDGAEEGGLIC